MLSKKTPGVLTGAVLALTAVALVLAGCTSKSKLDTQSGAGVPASISVTASPALIASGGTAIVEATILSEEGLGLANEIVAFSVDPASAGYFTPAVDTTDDSGAVATVFSADTSGTFTITAGLVGSTISSSVQLSVTANQEDSTEGTASITINTSTILMVANNADTAQITITVRDAMGQPAPNGTAVRIVAGEKFVDADGDGYWSEGVDTLTFDANGNSEWDANGTIPATAIIAEGTGQVSVDYVSGSTPGAVFIRATVDDNGLEGTRELSLQLQPNSNITISADPVLILASGQDTSLITITVKDGLDQPAPESTYIAIAAGEKFNDLDGNGYFTDGIDELTFDVNGNEQWDAMGQIPNTAVTTGDSGKVTLTYIAGLDPAAVFIKVTVNDNGITGSEEISLQSLSTEGNIIFDADPSLLLANGLDTSTITITIRDALGNPAEDGTLIKLAAGDQFSDVDGNGVWSVGVDNITHDVNGNTLWDVIGFIPATALVSGGTGKATVTYTADIEPGPVYIRATISDDRIQATAETTLQLTSDTALNSIYLSSDSMQLSVAQTGGIETGLLRATCYDMYGYRVWAGVPVDFVILEGPGGGEQLDSAGYGPFRAYTNTQGVATANIHSGTISGTVRIRAYSGTVLSNATQVLISAGPPEHIVVAMENCNVDYWDEVARSNVITAIVSDTYLNPVNDSTVVYFWCDEGTMKSHEERTFDHEGIANTLWFSGNNVDTADGRVMIFAETSGGTVRDSALFFNTHFPDTLHVWGWQTSILADGEQYFSVWVSAVDLNGNPVIGGTEFKGEAQYLSVAGGTFQDGCYSASDRVRVTSSTLKIDASAPGGNDDGWGAIDYVTYWHAAGAAITNVCSLATGYAYTGNSSINSQASAEPGELVHINVTIKDRYGNPLADHTLNMTASGGVIAGGTQETDAYGDAAGFTWTAAGLGEYTIVVTDTDPRGGVILTQQISVEI